MKATVRLRIFGHLMSAAIVKALPNTPITMMKIVMTPEKRLSPKEDLQKSSKEIIDQDSRVDLQFSWKIKYGAQLKQFSFNRIGDNS
jgi:hypothetical protein